MRQTTVRTRCECQSPLVATLNEERYVLSAYAIGREGDREVAPANSMGASNERFDVGWLCPICGRNTLRSFWADGLHWADGPTETPPAAGEPATKPA